MFCIESWNGSQTVVGCGWNDTTKTLRCCEAVKEVEELVHKHYEKKGAEKKVDGDTRYRRAILSFFQRHHYCVGVFFFFSYLIP